jgi:hypothetical protein
MPINNFISATIGTYFMFGIIGSYSPSSSQNVYIHIATITDTTVAKVRIASPFNNLHQEFTVANYTFRTISYTHIQTESGKQFKGIEIYADVNISVAVFPAYSANTEGFLVLPVTALSTRYVAASYHPSGYYSEILVAGVDSNTDVEINYTSNGKAKTQHIQLNQFETYQLIVTYDLSGALITSDKPVAVFSGSSYSQIPVGIGAVNYIVEQMIPQKYWSNRFIVPPIYPHNFFIVKIFVDYDNTEVHFYNSTHHFGSFLDRGSNQETLFGSEPIVILSTKPISVIQYCADNENMYGNPFMTTVQGISQYENVYKFATESYSGVKSTVAITLKRNDMSGLSLGEKNISSWNAIIIPVAHPMEEYVTIYVNISYRSLFRLHHTGGVRVGATLYGLLDTSYSYGYPLQLALSNAGKLYVYYRFLFLVSRQYITVTRE